MPAARLHAGDALTIGRVALTPIFVWTFAAGISGDAIAGVAAGVLFALLAASDYFDGILARRATRASARGRVWDSCADIFFIESALVEAVYLDLVPWWVPASIGASFAYYVLDSWCRARGTAGLTLLSSRLGHIGGICNYVLVGVLTYNEAAGIHLLGRGILYLLYCLVPIYSLGSVATRIAGRL